MKRQQHSNGSALLLVLIAVAIILMLMATQMRTLFIPQGTNTAPVGTEFRPWMLEEKYLAAGGDTIKLPRAPKLELTEPVTVEAIASREGLPRGTVSMVFDTDGRIQATWDCAYVSSEKNHTITAEMAGNVWAKRTYADDDGYKDKSRLFFFAKGHYEKQAGLAGTAEKGTAWLTGWLKPDRTIEGHVTIGQTTEWAAAYEIKTKE